MYRNLIAEMARNRISRKDIEVAISRTERCVRDKLNGKQKIHICEAKKIQKLFQGCTLDYLFETDEEG